MDTNKDIEQRNKKFETLKSFFKSNVQILETITNLFPGEMDDYNEETRIEYIDKLYKVLKELEIEFCDIASNFDFGLDVNEAIKQHFAKAKEQFLMSHYDSGIIQEKYKEQFSNMSPQFVEQVKEKCQGYTLDNSQNLLELVNNAKSVNELLHVIHSHIINNENILQAMPIIDRKQKNEICTITLYGEVTELSKKLFDSFPLELDVGHTDIISMENKILMMIRDVGHALTIDIDTTQENALVKYFVPKICNKNMVERLPGINKISENFATGMFESPKERLPEEIFDFIEKVPTDTRCLFDKEDAKEITMETSEKGIKISSIIELEEKIKKEIQIIKNNDSKEVKEDIYEEKDRNE